MFTSEQHRCSNEKNFSAEFKRESAQLVVGQNYTVADAARRVSEGHTKMEAIRCLKRYISHEVYTLLRNQNQADQQYPDNGLTLRRASRAVIIRAGSSSSYCGDTRSGRV